MVVFWFELLVFGTFYSRHFVIFFLNIVLYCEFSPEWPQNSVLKGGIVGKKAKSPE